MAGDGRLRGVDALAIRLAAGGGVADAARASGVSERTAYRRLADPDFCATVTRLRAELWESTAAQLVAAGAEAVKALVALLGAATPPAQRLGAARAVIELGVKLREVTELERRIADLEAGQQSQKGRAA